MMNQCSANVGGDPVSGCDNEAVNGDLCAMHVNLYRRMSPNKNYILQLMRDDDLHDSWGTAMAWGFAVAEALTVVGAEVPMDYSPSPFVQVESPDTYEPESYEDAAVWEYLSDVNEVWDADLAARISEVQQAAKILDRYLDWLRDAGLDY
jgi:hypothetical protein